MNQGDIYLVNLDPALHTEVAKTMPGMIISMPISLFLPKNLWGHQVYGSLICPLNM